MGLGERHWGNMYEHVPGQNELNKSDLGSATSLMWVAGI